jgi:hypothetical protein
VKIIVRPILDPQREIDLTHRLVAAIAEELWRLCGGNDKLNWIEAEWHLQRIVGQSIDEAREAQMVAPSRPSRVITLRTQLPRREREAAGQSQHRRPQNVARQTTEARARRWDEGSNTDAHHRITSTAKGNT